MDDAVEVGFLLGLLEDAGHRNVGQVVGVEVDEREFEDQRRQVVEVLLVLDLFGLQTFLEATLAQAVVARVQLEAGQSILYDVFSDLHAGLEVIELVVARIPLKDFGRNTFIGSQEPQLDAVAGQFREHFVDVGDFGVFHESALTIIDAVSEKDYSRNGG